MRGRKKETDKLGNVVIIGQGNVDQAKDFDTTHGKGLRAVVDSDRRTYALLSMERSWASTLGPRSAARAVQATAGGFVQGATQGDAFQQGGVLVVRAGGKPVFFYRSRFAGDHPEVEAVIDSLREASTIEE